MNTIIWHILLGFAVGLISSCPYQRPSSETLRQSIENYLEDKNATVGVSIVTDDGTDTLSINGDMQCPMQSVFKFHIGLTILSEIDKGNLALDQKIQVDKQSLLPYADLWSPLRDKYPDGGSFTIRQLIEYAVSQSDNVACDVLLDLVESPKYVEQFIKQQGIKDIAINFNEILMQAHWENMYQNWTTPKAASETLMIFYNYKNKILSEASHSFIWQTMKSTSTGINRLKGLLPQNVDVAHKTGSSGMNKDGITAATNDVGIIFLPNKRFFIISVFVTNSKESEATNEKIIAEIAKRTYDFYSLPQE